jgi:hypothetical protein
MFATADQFIFFTIVSVLGLAGTLWLLSLNQKQEEPYISDIGYIVCAVGWLICYVAGVVGIFLS